MKKINMENNKNEISEFEDNEHLTIVDINGNEKEIMDLSPEGMNNKEVYESTLENTSEENNKKKIIKKEKKSLFSAIHKLYGVSNEDDDDLEFVYTSYATSNEKPSGFLNSIFIIVIGIFTSLLLWAGFAEIDELTRGNGKVIPTDKIQTVQSLDGGIILEISIKEGQIVKKGDPLMKIDTTRFQASLEESKQEYLSLLALRTRLESESIIDIYKNVPRLKFDKKVLNNHSRYDKNEELLFINRFNELKSSINVLNTQYNQKKQELKEILSTIKKLKKNLEFLTKQRGTIRKLVKKGIKSNYDLLNIEKEYYETQGDLNTAKVSISRSNYSISESSNRIKEKVNAFKSEASSLLQKASGQINKFEARLVGDNDKVAKTIIVSPVDGIVKQLNYNTLGGVVQSGAPLVEIVPSSDALVVEAKIDPKDIAFINPKQMAIIKITAYDFSIYGGLDGKIVEISADSIIDKESRDNKSYYRVLIKTDKNYLERNDERLPIIPGMVASVDIVTGKRTILDFLLKPILKVKQNSLHER